MRRMILVCFLLISSLVYAYALDSLDVTIDQEFGHIADHFDMSVRLGDYVIAPCTERIIQIFHYQGDEPLEFVNSWQFDASLVDFVASGNDGYMAIEGEEGEIRHIDFSDPVHPQFVGLLPVHDGYIRFMKLIEGKLLVSWNDAVGSTGGLAIYDVEANPDPSGFTFIATPYAPQAVDLEDHQLALSFGSLGHSGRLYDLHNLSNPVQLAELPVPLEVSEDPFNSITSILIRGDVLYLAGGSMDTGQSWFQAVDIGNPQEPAPGTLITAEGYYDGVIHDLHLAGSSIIASKVLEDHPGDPGNGMSVLDVSIPLVPEVLLVIDTLGSRYLQAWDETTLCVNRGDFDAVLLDMTTPFDPVVMSEVPSGGRYVSMLPAGDKVLRIGEDGNITLFDPFNLDDEVRLHASLEEAFYYPLAARLGERHLTLLESDGWSRTFLNTFDLAQEPPAMVSSEIVGYMGNAITFSGSTCYYFGSGLCAYTLGEDGQVSLRASIDLDIYGEIFVYGDTLLITGEDRWDVVLDEGDHMTLLGSVDTENVDQFKHVRTGNTIACFNPQFGTLIPAHVTDPLEPLFLDPITFERPDWSFFFRASSFENTIAVTFQGSQSNGVGDLFALFEFDDNSQLTGRSLYEGDGFGERMIFLSNGMLLGNNNYNFNLASIGHVGVEEDASRMVPTRFALGSAYPNPFNPSTTIPFELQHAGRAEVSVYDLMGRLVTTLVAGQQSAGQHRVEWDGQSASGMPVASGSYIVQLEADGQKVSKFLTLVK